AANAKLEHATCFTCSANVRTSVGPNLGSSCLNRPAAGRSSHLSAGIASAAERTSYSWFLHCRAKALPGVSSRLISAAGGRCWCASACPSACPDGSLRRGEVSAPRGEAPMLTASPNVIMAMADRLMSRYLRERHPALLTWTILPIDYSHG